MLRFCPSVSFEVPGKAVPAPRASIRGGQGGYYADPRYDGWKDQVAAAALNATGGVRLDHDGSVRLYVQIGRERTRVDVHFDDSKPTGRADVDNLAKGIMDALQDILYRNDRQVMYLSAEKGANYDRAARPPDRHPAQRELLGPPHALPGESDPRPQ